MESSPWNPGGMIHGIHGIVHTIPCGIHGIVYGIHGPFHTIPLDSMVIVLILVIFVKGSE